MHEKQAYKGGKRTECVIFSRESTMQCAIVITWINTPLVSSMWMRSKLDEKIAT